MPYSFLRENGLIIGSLKTGKRNKITDVDGILVGHSTVDTNENKTGVTVVVPSRQNIFTNKLIAAAHVLNGFGKTQGLVQLEELGTLETPIALTNTLNIGLVHDAMVSYMIAACKEDGIAIKSVNPVVGECNDYKINKIENRVIQKENVFQAIASACADFETGDVGAGKGTVCFGLKGGIGSASRELQIGAVSYTIGVLVQSNHGVIQDLMIDGNPVGRILKDYVKEETSDKGSIVIIIATDLPVSCRQLKRILKRSSVGLARTGSYIGHGSGEIVIGFSTSNTLDEALPVQHIQILNEKYMDDAFRAAAEAVEEAILNSMFSAGPVTGYDGKVTGSIRDFIEIRNGTLILKE